jgi:hypothetical protein
MAGTTVMDTVPTRSAAPSAFTKANSLQKTFLLRMITSKLPANQGRKPYDASLADLDDNWYHLHNH